ncbi:hypothetical protein ACOSQ4_016160 [Xanthoceras sorbifolium]
MIIRKYKIEWLNANGGDESSCSISWSPPQGDMVKVKADGSRNRDSGNIAAGGVLRDQNRRWIKGFPVYKGIGNNIESEFWAIVEGMIMAWDDGYRRVQEEFDSLEAVSLVKEDSPPYPDNKKKDTH